MIPKIILGKGDTRRLIAYLFGKGTANEHVDPHLVASWNGFAPDPGRSPHRDPKEVEKQLHTQLDQPVAILGRRAPKTTVWHCPLRAAPEDPILTDAQWAEIALRIVAAAASPPPETQKPAAGWPYATPTTTSTSPPPSSARTAAAPAETTTYAPFRRKPARSKSTTDSGG